MLRSPSGYSLFSEVGHRNTAVTLQLGGIQCLRLEISSLKDALSNWRNSTALGSWIGLICVSLDVYFYIFNSQQILLFLQ